MLPGARQLPHAALQWHHDSAPLPRVRGKPAPIPVPNVLIPSPKAALTNSSSCWDGVNVDSPDHQSHMYDTQIGAFQNAAPCPASHPVRVPQVAYETLWDTSQFNDLWEGGENPFFLSYSDHHGFGTHADYVSCPSLTLFLRNGLC